MADKFNADYCPACGTRMSSALRHGRMRPVCPACGYVVYFDPKVAVIAFIEHDGKILLVRRGVSPEVGLWSLPGGFVELGEGPVESLKRELLEETGLKIRIGELLDVFHLPEYSYVIVIAYSASVLSGQISAGDDAANVNWFAKNELPELAFDSTRILARRWVEDAF